jgi:lipoprotein signal peptidase
MTVVAVLVIDHVLKLLLRATSGFQSVRLGPFGSLGMVTGALWVNRLSKQGPKALWLWAIAAAWLLVASTWIPSTGVFVGLLLGGSLSNAMEASLRGFVTDYVCLRFWPAFNLADVAVTVGATGIVIELLRATGAFAA